MGVFILLGAAALLIVAIGTRRLIHSMTHPPRHTLGTALARGWPSDPAAVGLAFAEREVALPTGLVTPVWLITGGNPAGPVLVLAHGWGESRFELLPRAARLAGLASELVLYDQRGHGEAAPLRGAGKAGDQRCTFGGREADDLLALVDELAGAEDANPRPIVLVGYSMGALAVLAAGARDEAGRIAGVIVDGAYRFRTEPVAAVLWEQRWPGYPFVWLAAGYFALTPGSGGSGRSGGRFDRAAHAARLKCPLLVLHGRRDTRIRLATAEAIAAAAPRGKLVVLDEAGHLDLPPTEEARYVAAVCEFLAGLPPLPC